jgi:hypothetical protein
MIFAFYCTLKQIQILMEKLEKEWASFEVVDNILIGTYFAREVNLEVAQKVTVDRHNYTKDRKYPVLVDYRLVSSTTKQARDYFNSEYASQNLTAMAVLIDSPVGKIIAAFFLKIIKPTYRIKVFTDKPKALKWLSQFI